ncbi:hypothetical protein AB0B74_18310 [Micromonospora parva]|uniref:hypothetical protein n=1 Tax=Micromonospora parva TaxID=1464048 RepID=UPI0033F26893
MSVLIELGDDRGAPLDERRPPQQVSRRWRVGALLATVGRDGHRVSVVLPAGLTDCRRVGAGMICRDGTSRMTFWPLDAP